MQEPEKDVKSRFGSDVASAMYARLRTIAAENEILKVYDLEVTESEVGILLFNSFKMIRNLETEAVSVFERDYATGKWKPCEPCGVMEVIPVWPIHNLKGGLAGAVKGYLLRKLYAAAEFDRVREECHAQYIREVNNLTVAGMEVGEAEELAESRFPDLAKLQIAKRAFADRIFGSAYGRGGRRVKGFVSHDAVYNGLKGLRAAFFNHFRDPELFRAILSMNHRAMSLADYLYFGKNRAGVLKVWSERRNLMPILPYISMDRWADDELFSIGTWTSRKGIVANEGFSRASPRRVPSQAIGSGRLVPFGSERAFKWLARSKSSVVKAWVQGHRDPRAADMMAEINLPRDTAVLVIAKTVSELSIALATLDRFDQSVTDHRQALIRLHRAYAAHWTERRKQIGYRPMIQEMLYQDGIRDVLDYLINEGFRDGIPARNATWASLQRRSAEWHAVHAPVPRYDDGFCDGDIEKQEWESLLGPMEVDGCKVMPLSDVNSVVAEGNDMGHCVGGYARTCSKDRYRVFSIVEPDGTRSTLGISLGLGTAEFDQVRGVANGSVSDRVRRVSEYVTSMYLQAIYDAAEPEPEAA